MKSCVESVNTSRAAQLIDDIASAFSNLISSDEKGWRTRASTPAHAHRDTNIRCALFADLSIEKIFDPDTGTIGFLHKSISQHKAFGKENVKIFELYLDIVGAHTNQIAPYAANIFNVIARLADSFEARKRSITLMTLSHCIRSDLPQVFAFVRYVCT